MFCTQRMSKAAGAGGWCRLWSMCPPVTPDTDWPVPPGPRLVERRARWRSDAGDTLMQTGECHHCM